MIKSFDICVACKKTMEFKSYYCPLKERFGYSICIDCVDKKDNIYLLHRSFLWYFKQQYIFNYLNLNAFGIHIDVINYINKIYLIYLKQFLTKDNICTCGLLLDKCIMKWYDSYCKPNIYFIIKHCDEPGCHKIQNLGFFKCSHVYCDNYRCPECYYKSENRSLCDKCLNEMEKID